jgi:hypothetical protein
MSLEIDKVGRLKIPEKNIQQACIEFLRLERGPNGLPVWEVYETHSHHAYASAGEPGQPDVIAINAAGPLILRLEMKAKGKYRTWEQREWAERHQVKVHTIRSVEELKSVMVMESRH